MQRIMSRKQRDLGLTDYYTCLVTKKKFNYRQKAKHNFRCLAPHWPEVDEKSRGRSEEFKEKRY